MNAAAPDLVANFADALGLLPDVPDGDPRFTALDASSLGPPPPTLATSGLCVTAGHHWYGNFLADQVSIEADKTTLRALGLLLLASIFHPHRDPLQIHLSHPRSTIRTLLVESLDDPADATPGLSLRPVRFNYYPRSIARHPWLDDAPQPHALPVVTLSNARGFVDSVEELGARDVLVGFGPRDAMARMAELLLNVGRASSDVDEIRLEGEAGFRGVGPASAELAIWLPGSFGYLDTPPATREG